MTQSQARAALAAAPTVEDVGRVTGKSGLGILMLLAAIGGSQLAPVLPDGIDALVAMAKPWLLTAGIPLVGWGLIEKARKLAAILRAVADAIEALPQPPPR